MTSGEAPSPALRRLLLALGAVIGIAVVVVVVAIGGCGGGDDDGEPAEPAAAPAAAAQGPTLADVPDITARLEPSVVAVIVEGEAGAGEGSGVVIRPDTIVTNNHVIEGARSVQVALASGERLSAEVRATDPRTDIALLTVERGGLPVAEFADRIPPVGSLAIAVGNPLGFEGSVTAGIVSGVDRAIPSGGTTPALVGLIQTDAAISPGNSGGALVDGEGRVIGMNVAYIPPQARAVSIGFAIPAPTVTTVVEQLLEDGTAEAAFLGVRLRPITPQMDEQLGLDSTDGALVIEVTEGGPAAEAGMRAGDVIVELAGRRVRIVEDVIAELRGRSGGDEVQVEVVREGERRTLTVRLGSR